MKSFGRKVFLAACAAAITLTSCNNSGENDDMAYIPVQEEENGPWVFINSKGEKIGDQSWEYEPSITVNGLFTAQVDEGLTVYKWSGSKATPLDSLTNLVSVGVLHDGLLPVTPPMQRIRLVDGNGKLKFTLDPIGGKEVTSCASQFTEGLLVISTSDGKEGVIDTKGDIVVKPDRFDEISGFNGGYALAAIYNYHTPGAAPEYYVIDKEGKAKKVEGEFGYWEGDCTSLPAFENGIAYVPGKILDIPEPEEEEDVKAKAKKKKTVKPKKKKTDEELENPVDTTYQFTEYKISTDATASRKDDAISWFKVLPNGGLIANTYKNGENTYIWTDKEGKEIKKTRGLDASIMDYGNYVVVKEKEVSTVYNLKGSPLYKLGEDQAPYWSKGSFGLMTVAYNDGYSSMPTVYTLLNDEGQPVSEERFYGVGTNKVTELYGDEDTECEKNRVTSAYIDIEAAAGAFTSMLTGNVKGKSVYKIGEYCSSILADSGADAFLGDAQTFDIPTDSTNFLANGAGYWVQGTGLANAPIATPKFKNVMKIEYYDATGKAFGHKEERVVSVSFNKSAKVIAFDLLLRTNHPSGEVLREAVAARLKAAGFTLEREDPFFEEYTSGNRNIIIYGNHETDGLGALVYDKNSGIYKTPDEIATMSAQL